MVEPLAGEPRRVNRVFAFLGILLCRAPLIVEADHILRLEGGVGDDKAHMRKLKTWSSSIAATTAIS